MRRWLVFVALCGACQARSPSPAPVAVASVADVPTPAQVAADPTRLPEDPVAGARSLEVMREHREEEERERKANFDRRRLKQHRQLLATLRQARDRYESAKGEPAVKQLQAKSERLRAEAEQRIDAIDHWRNSSGLLDDYAALLNALSTDYPTARLKALSGDSAELLRVRRDTDARFAKAEEWLAEAERAEDE